MSPRTAVSRLKRNRVVCPAGVPHCKVGVGSYGKTKSGLRQLDNLGYRAPCDSRRRPKGKLSRRALKQLTRRKRIDVIVAVGMRVPLGDYRVKPIVATLRVRLIAP